MIDSLPSQGMTDILRAQAAQPDPQTPAELAALVLQEQAAWGRVVLAGNIRLD